MKPLVDRVSEFLETETDGFLQAYSNFNSKNINLLDKDEIVDSNGTMKSYGSTNRTFQTYTADESGRDSTALGFFIKTASTLTSVLLTRNHVGPEKDFFFVWIPE